MSSQIPFLDAEAVARLRPRDAVQALIDALRGGLDTSTGAPRSRAPLRHGAFLMMPAEHGADAGVKVLGLAPGNPERGLPSIQGLFLLFDAETLTPRAVLDGAELTALRTPAVSLAGIRHHLLADESPLDLLIFGGAIQAVRHATVTADVLEGHRPLGSVTFAVRSPQSANLPEEVAGVPVQIVQAGTADADAAVRRAGLIHCATSAREPLFDSALVRDDAIVVAMGSHEPDAREVDEHLVARSRVIVEDRENAMREAGDVVLAVEAGVIAPGDFVTFADIAQEEPHRADRPVLFKSVGMAWEDVVVAGAVVAAQP